jgi:hypothetical protein
LRRVAARVKAGITHRGLPCRMLHRLGTSVEWSDGRLTRQHHLLSNIETSYFYILEWAPSVVDVREQFPLPLNATREIAAALRIAHPRIPKSSDDWTMTTDFLVTVAKNGREKLLARAIKPSSELTKARVIEKLEIERAFWASQNVDWGLVTEKEIDPVLVENVKYVHRWHRPEDLGVPPHTFAAAESLILDFASQNISLAQAALAADDRLGFQQGDSLQLVRHFIASRRWHVDMTKRIDPSQRLVVTNRPSQKIYDSVRKYAA